MDIILIILMALIVLTSFVPPICSAIMDLIDFKFEETIFNRPNSTKKIFGIPWQLWFNQAKGWLNKYKDRDPKKGPRSYTFLFITSDWIQLSDAWHFFKMIAIGFQHINRSLYLILGIYLGVTFTTFLGSGLWLVMASVLAAASFIYHAFDWNVTFNLFFDKLLIKRTQ